ncbi:uncharacterized protein ARMOST_12869 [Armillaria ostoyae]|uniref:Uncharacterized protein n=1 Tax=Armillaria ostoyae TaxID=47428 RepID=A0A284RL70_ARMOS|nr:uncharacterized protein ARMOST_12869 [Armillaria ostoyae]
MASIQLYFKPRPISRKYGHSKYLPFKWPFDSKYGPFFADYGTIPSDATEVYTIQSSALVTSLSTFYNKLIPGLDAKVPNPNKFHRSEWSGLLQLAVAKADSSFCFQLECEDHIVRLAKGNRAPPPPPTDMRIIDLSPEWYNIVYSTHIRGNVELRDKSRDTELELFVWVYMFYVADDRAEIWRGFRQEMYQLTKFFFSARLPSAYAKSPGLFDLVSSRAYTAASAFASALAVKPSANENEPPLLSLPSSNGLSSTDSTSFSHAGDSSDEADLSALNRPSRRRNFVVVDSVNV